MKQMYCKYCGVAVRDINRGEKPKTIGRGELPSFVHVTKRSEKDPVQCHRPNLYSRDVTDEDWWR